MTPYTLAIEFTPVTLRRIVDCVATEKHADRVDEDRFTLIEMVAHLADWEDIWLDRMRAAAEYPGSAIEAYDEGQRAIDKDYAGRNIQHELEVFENRRRDTLDFLRGLRADDWSKTVVHPEGGPRTIRDQVELILGHDLYHLEQASRYLR